MGVVDATTSLPETSTSTTIIYDADEISLVQMITTALHATEEQLFAEKKLSSALKQRLQLKAASIDCQLIEKENLLGNSKADLEDALRKNSDLTKQLVVMKNEKESLLATTAKADLEDALRKNSDLTKQLVVMKNEKESLLRRTAKADLEDALRKNSDLTKQLVVMKNEKESLLRRTAVLARRDQIQKASIMTSNAEIAKLMSTIEGFQDRFRSLASGLLSVPENEGGQDQVSSANNDNDESNNITVDSYVGRKTQQSQHEAREDEWKTERTILNGCIQKLKSNNDEMKSKFMQTLTKHQSAWHSERDALKTRITEFLLEKEKELLFCNSKDDLEDALRKNSDLTKQLVVVKNEKESLLRRTAVLARRDQIQKASIMTYNTEILKLMSTIEGLEDRFRSLASGLLSVAGNMGGQEQVSSANNDNDERDESINVTVDNSVGQKARKLQDEAREDEWKTERTILNGCIQKLQSDSEEMKSKFMQTLTKHQSAWNSERDALKSRITELLLETDTVEVELLLEKDAYIVESELTAPIETRKCEQQHRC